MCPCQSPISFTTSVEACLVHRFGDVLFFVFLVFLRNPVGWRASLFLSFFLSVCPCCLLAFLACFFLAFLLSCFLALFFPSFFPSSRETERNGKKNCRGIVLWRTLFKMKQEKCKKKIEYSNKKVTGISRKTEEEQSPQLTWCCSKGRRCLKTKFTD